MSEQWVPKEVFVVEGRSDTQRLRAVFGPQVRTIETNGSAVSRTLIPQLKQAQKHVGLIIFTDPDFQGDRIRRLVQEIVPEAKHAYLTPDQATGTRAGASLGVEHASEEAIRQAVKDLVAPDAHSWHTYLIPQADLIRLGLIAHPMAQARRDYLSQRLSLGHLNGKQLRKQLAQYHVSLSTVEELLNEMEAASHGT